MSLPKTGSGKSGNLLLTREDESTEFDSGEGTRGGLLAGKAPGEWGSRRLPVPGKGLGGQDANAWQQGPLSQGHLATHSQGRHSSGRHPTLWDSSMGAGV